MDLTALVEEHSRRAAAESPVTYALLRAIRFLQDGRAFVEGDFREWIAEGERLRGESAPSKLAAFEETQARTWGIQPNGIPVVPLPASSGVTLATGDDDRPRSPFVSMHDFSPAALARSQSSDAEKTLTPAQQRMAKARAAKAARKGAA